MSINVSGNGPEVKLTGKVGGGVGKHLFAQFTKNEDGTCSCNVTYEQACAAMELGYEVIAVGEGHYAPLAMMRDDGMVFASVSLNPLQIGTAAYQMFVQCFMLIKERPSMPNVTAAFNHDICYLLPPVEEDDEDKIMVAYGGAWHMEPMPTLEVDDDQLLPIVRAQIAEYNLNGELKGDKGDKGDTYTLTEGDKTEIASVVFDEVLKTTALDFSNWQSGSFKESLGDGSVVTHDVVFDDNGNVTSVGGIAISGVF